MWAARPEWGDVPTWDPLTQPHGPEALPQWAPPDRVVVAAAHPDDESLGAGGLVATLRAVVPAIPVLLVVATAGERSHPRSPSTTPAALARIRHEEARQAWAALGGEPASMVIWDLPDGELATHEESLTTRLVDIVGDGRRTLLVTPYDDDGHPDHDALGRAGRRVAHRTGAHLLHFPVWFWHHRDPATAPWARMRRLPLRPPARQAKSLAIAHHASQVAPLSAAPGDETLLGAALLEHFGGADEIFIEGSPDDDSFDALHTQSDDPWGTTTRWYEERKRQVLQAMLPQPRFRRALDLGCSTGTQTAELALRCDAVLALDRSPRAVGEAQQRVSGLPHVEVRVADLPQGWPDGTFDLIVVSESGYFLSPVALDDLISRVAGSLTPDGCLVLAHWRHPIVGWPLSGPEVHERFTRSPELPEVTARYTDRDVEVLVLSAASTMPNPSR